MILASRVRKEKRGMLGDDDDGPVAFLHPHSDTLNDLENG